VCWSLQDLRWVGPTFTSSFPLTFVVDCVVVFFLFSQKKMTSLSSMRFSAPLGWGAVTTMIARSPCVRQVKSGCILCIIFNHNEQHMCRLKIRRACNNTKNTTHLSNLISKTEERAGHLFLFCRFVQGNVHVVFNEVHISSTHACTCTGASVCYKGTIWLVVMSCLNFLALPSIKMRHPKQLAQRSEAYMIQTRPRCWAF